MPECNTNGCFNEVDNDGEICEECLEVEDSMSNREIASYHPASSDERGLLNDMDDEPNTVPNGFDSAEEHDSYIDSLVNEGIEKSEEDDEDPTGFFGDMDITPRSKDCDNCDGKAIVNYMGHNLCQDCADDMQGSHD